MKMLWPRWVSTSGMTQWYRSTPATEPHRTERSTASRNQGPGDTGYARSAILQDLEEVAALRILDRRQPPVVDDEDIEAGELGEQADVGAIGPGQGELVEEARSPAVAGSMAAPARTGSIQR